MVGVWCMACWASHVFFFLATQWHTSCKEESLPGTSQVVMSTLTESFWANDNNTSLPPCARREQACFQIVSWKIIQILMPPLFFWLVVGLAFENTGPGVTWDPYKFTHSHSQLRPFFDSDRGDRWWRYPATTRQAEFLCMQGVDTSHSNP